MIRESQTENDNHSKSGLLAPLILDSIWPLRNRLYSSEINFIYCNLQLE